MKREVAESTSLACLAGREETFVNGVDVGLRQLAVGLEELIDELIDGRVIARRVVIPDFVVSRTGRLFQGF